MGRIDRALRRAGDGRLPAAVAEREDQFVPAWSLEAEAAPAVADANRENAGPEAPGSLLVADEYPAIRGFNAAWRERLASGSERDNLLVEQFRRLAGTLHDTQANSGIRTIMVCSAAAGDGKTLTALNLALVLSESYLRRVLLIDADLRRPSLGDIADVTGCTGLSDALKAPAEQKLALVQLTPRLTLLPAGRPDSDPLGGLTSPRMQRILEDAAAAFDWVILDAPPVGPLADATLLSRIADGTLFVVRAGRTHYSLVQRGIEALGRERILGVVLNGVERMPDHSYERYYEYVDPQRQRVKT